MSISAVVVPHALLLIKIKHFSNSTESLVYNSYVMQLELVTLILLVRFAPSATNCNSFMEAPNFVLAA